MTSPADYVYDVILVHRAPDGGTTWERYSTLSYTSENNDILLASLYAGFYEGRVKNPGVILQSLWGDGRTRGPRDVGAGVAQFLNQDGVLDFWMLYAYDGCSYEVFVAPKDDRENRTMVFQGVIEQEPILDATQATLNIRDMLYSLTKPVLTAQYAGNNNLPNGLEGSATDIKGRIKPLAIGVVRNVTPPCVNTSSPVYQLSAEKFGDGYAVSVYVNRVLLTPGIELGVQGNASDDISGPAIRKVAAMAVATGTDGLPLYAVFDSAGNFPAASHGYTAGDVLVLGNYVNGSTTYALPAGLSNAQYYYIGFYNSQYFRLYTNRADALTFGSQGRVYQDTVSPARNNSFEAWTNKTVRGRYDWLNRTGLGFFVRTGTDTTAQQVTCDITAPIDLPSGGGTGTTYSGIGANPAGNGNQPQEIVQYLMERAFQTSALTVTASLAQYPNVGVYIDDDRTFLQAINDVLQGVSAGFYFDRSLPGSGGIGIRLKQLREPLGASPAASFTESDILDIQRVNANDDDKGIPAWRVNVQYQKNFTIQTASQLPGIALSQLGFTTEEYRTVSAADETVKDQWPLAPEITIQSNIDATSDAQAEATRLLGLYGKRRNMFNIDIPLGEGFSLNLGDMVNVSYPRFNLVSGKTFQIIGMQYNLRKTPIVTLTIWG